MLKYLIFTLIVFSFTPLAFAQNSTLIDSYFDNLSYFFESDTSVNIFYPIIFMAIVLIFTSYALANRQDPLSSVFSIGAVPICIILALMFISPTIFDYTETSVIVTISTDIDDNVFTEITNATKTIPIISNDQQFRFIFSNFFLLFAIFNGLITVLIISGRNKK